MQKIYTPAEILAALETVKQSGLKVRPHLSVSDIGELCPMAATVLVQERWEEWQERRYTLADLVYPAMEEVSAAFLSGFIDAVDGYGFVENSGAMLRPADRAYAAFVYALGYTCAELAGVKNLPFPESE